MASAGLDSPPSVALVVWRSNGRLEVQSPPGGARTSVALPTAARARLRQPQRPVARGSASGRGGCAHAENGRSCASHDAARAMCATAVSHTGEPRGVSCPGAADAFELFVTEAPLLLLFTDDIMAGS